MGKFTPGKSKKLPAISTASLPDIIFMLLIFFMVTTTIREASVFLKVTTPTATEVQKLEKKGLVSYVYVGPPMNAKLGTESRIQLNDRFATVADISDFVIAEREARDEVDRQLITTSLKVDKATKMGIVTDIKQELRQIGAFKINYSAKKEGKQR
ncbi:MAG TPA: biopolymer transporter ExbD [Bacteroidales bacterium]|nr:biopolymer transporter ExbD [Bacteroidales bacterium]